MGFPLVSYSQRFCSVVDQSLFEPLVLQSLLSRDSAFWIIYEDLAQEVEELSVEGVLGRYEFLYHGSVRSHSAAKKTAYVEVLHRLDVFSGCPRGLVTGIVKL